MARAFLAPFFKHQKKRGMDVSTRGIPDQPIPPPGSELFFGKKSGPHIDSAPSCGGDACGRLPREQYCSGSRPGYFYDSPPRQVGPRLNFPASGGGLGVLCGAFGAPNKQPQCSGGGAPKASGGLFLGCVPPGGALPHNGRRPHRTWWWCWTTTAPTTTALAACCPSCPRTPARPGPVPPPSGDCVLKKRRGVRQHSGLGPRLACPCSEEGETAARQVQLAAAQLSNLLPAKGVAGQQGGTSKWLPAESRATVLRGKEDASFAGFGPSNLSVHARLPKAVTLTSASTVETPIVRPPNALPAGWLWAGRQGGL